MPDRDAKLPISRKSGNCLCTWFRFDQDAAGARFGAQSLQEQGQEGSVAISVPIEAKDELAEILGAAGPDRGQPQAARRVAVAAFDRSGDRHLAFGAAPGPEGAPLSRCGWLASPIPTRPDSGLRSGVTMARRSLAASIQALRQDPMRFCNCRAEMPLQWVAIRQAARNQIASDSLVWCRRVPAVTEA